MEENNIEQDFGSGSNQETSYLDNTISHAGFPGEPLRLKGGSSLDQKGHIPLDDAVKKLKSLMGSKPSSTEFEGNRKMGSLGQ